MDDCFTLIVPLNQKGEQDLQYAGPDLDNCRCFDLTGDEYEELNPLFDAYNLAFRIIIDAYEEEVLPVERVDTALSMARVALSRAGNEVERHGLRTLIEALELAQERHTFMMLAF